MTLVTIHTPGLLFEVDNPARRACENFVKLNPVFHRREPLWHLADTATISERGPHGVMWFSGIFFCEKLGIKDIWHLWQIYAYGFRSPLWENGDVEIGETGKGTTSKKRQTELTNGGSPCTRSWLTPTMVPMYSKERKGLRGCCAVQCRQKPPWPFLFRSVTPSIHHNTTVQDSEVKNLRRASLHWRDVIRWLFVTTPIIGLDPQKVTKTPPKAYNHQWVIMGDRRRSPPRGPLGPPRGPGGGGRGPPDRGGYKVLCVSSLHPKASDDVVRDTLYREYKKYGDISVRVMHEPDERVAYVYFRNFDDARDAKHSKSRIILFDKPAMVEAVYESASREEYDNRGARPHSKIFSKVICSQTSWIGLAYQCGDRRPPRHFSTPLWRWTSRWRRWLWQT